MAENPSWKRNTTVKRIGLQIKMKVVEIRTQAIWYNGEGKNTNEMFVGQIGKHILCIRVGL